MGVAADIVDFLRFVALMELIQVCSKDDMVIELFERIV